MLTVLAECIVPVRCINPRTDYSTAPPPTLDWWVAFIIILACFAIAGALMFVRRNL